jgi:hypothetical protein
MPRRPRNDGIKADIANLARQLVEMQNHQGNSKIRPALFKHLKTNYYEKSRAQAKNLNLALETLVIMSQNDGKWKYGVTEFKEMREYLKRQHELPDMPENIDDIQNLPIRNGIIEFYNRQKENNVWHMTKYEMGVASKAFNLVKQGEILMYDIRALEILPRVPVSDHPCSEIANKLRHNLAMFGPEYWRNRYGEDSERVTSLLTIMNQSANANIDILESEWWASALVLVYVRWIGNNEGPANFQPFSARRVRDAINERYIANPFLVYEMNFEEDDPDAPLAKFVKRSNNVSPYYPELKESCLATTIIDVYKKNFDKLFTYKKLELTMELLVRICKEVEYNGGEVELTIEEASKFFKEYYIGFEVYNYRNELMYAYAPERTKHNLRPKIMRVIYHNNHVENVTGNKRFEQPTMHHKQAQTTIEVSNKFRLPKSPPKEDDVIMAHGDVMQCITTIKDTLRGFTPVNTGTTKLNVVYTGDMTSLAKYMVTQGYTVNVTTQKRTTVTFINMPNIVIQVDGVDRPLDITIKGVSDIIGIGDTELNKDEYLAFVELSHTFETMLINKRHLSHFSMGVLFAFSRFGNHICTGSMVEDDIETIRSDNLICLDHNKYYASCLAECPYIPSISLFEDFVEYDGHGFREDYLYIVDIQPNPIYNRNRIMIYGFVLMKLMKFSIEIKIVGMLRVIKHSSEMVVDLLGKMFDGKHYLGISERLRKGVVNKAIGKCGKKYNKTCKTTLFRNHDDAWIYVKEHPLARMFVWDEASGIYAASEGATSTLEHGFWPVYEMILDIARFNMFKLYNSMVKSALYRVIGFRTDAIYAQLKADFDVMKDSCLIGKFHDGLGGLKEPEYHKLPPAKRIEIVDKRQLFDNVDGEKYSDSLLNVVSDYKENRIALESEEMEVVMEKIGNRTLLIGVAGAGKSANATGYAKRKYTKEEILAVVPTNSMAKRFMVEYGLNAITYHRLKGENIQEENRTRGYDIDGVKCMIFDEILLLKHSQLIKISKFMEEHVDVEYLATCGAEQLPAINDPVDCDLKLKYLMSEKLFSNVIELKINKRVNTEDRERLEEILEDLKEAKGGGHNAWIGVIRKHFKDNMIKNLDGMKEKGIHRALSYFTDSRDLLNNHINSYFDKHSKHLEKNKVYSEDGAQYHHNQRLVVKNSIKTKDGVRLHPNYEYKIKKFNNKEFTLEDVLDESTIVLEKKVVDKNFAFSFCNTVHSSQGDSIDEAFIIADWRCKWTTDKWLYTAITRTKSLMNIWFLEQDLLYDVRFTEKMNELIKGYREQDKKAKREWKAEEYVTVDWFKEELDRNGMICRVCGDEMTYKGGPKGVSVNRKVNTLAHVKLNCELCCLICNCSIKDRDMV